MNAKLVFEQLKNKNINDAEYRYVSNKSFSFEVFNGELRNYTTNVNSSINIDAVINNKLAMITTENLSNSNIPNLINELIENAKVINKDTVGIYKNLPKYKKYNHFNKELENIDSKRKIDLILQINNKIKNFDSRISDIQIEYLESFRKYEFDNTYGIKIKNKNNEYNIGCYVIAKKDKLTKTSYLTFVDNDFTKFNIDSFVKEVCENAIKKLDEETLETKKYPVVFSPEVTSTLLEYYVSQLNAELILKNLSWFKDKINTQVANKRVTIIETPLKRDQFFSNADDQGVPTVNRPLIKKGVLLTYLHNLETAKAFNVEPTGHASIGKNKMGISAHSSLYLKPGRLTKEEILKKANNGIYITDIEGLHAGMNAQNGNFSLKAEGFIIKDGMLTKACAMMTISSNLFTIFNTVKLISKNIEYIHNGVFAPAILVKNVSISF